MKQKLKEWLKTIGYALLIVVVSFVLGGVLSLPIIGLLKLLIWIFESDVVALCIIAAIAFIGLVLLVHKNR